MIVICGKTGLPAVELCGECVECLRHVLYERQSDLATLESENAALKVELAAVMEDRKRLDWLESIRPIGCWDGWVEAGDHSRQATVFVNAEEGESNVVRDAIDAARQAGEKGDSDEG